MSSLREVTREQFANGTTIDAGTRLERALADLVGRFNALRPRDVKRRWFPSVCTGGYMPSAGTSQEAAPWLSVANINGVTVAVPPPEGLQNTWRNKGLRNVLIDPDGGNGDQLSWTTALHFSKPAIVTGIALYAGTDGAYFTNDFYYTGLAPAPKTNLPSDDLVVELAVDHPWRNFDALAGQQEFLRTQFRLDAHRFNPVLSAPAGYADPIPQFASNAAYAGTLQNPNGVMFLAPDLNIPLPEKSDMRLSFIIPKYRDATWSGWGVAPWRKSHWSWALHVLEAAE